MNRLNRVTKKSRNTGRAMPVYDFERTNVLRQEISARRKTVIIAAAIIAGALGALYVPGLFMRDAETAAGSAAAVTADTSAIAASAQILRDSPNEDFDGDGLDNLAETNAGTDPWNADTDGDGATDFYEVKVSDTDPTKADTQLMQKLQKKADEEAGDDISIPYRMGNVIMWPDDYAAKANGTVVDTRTGYRFRNFSGYVQFMDGSRYAYSVTDGTHESLYYSEKNDAWRIDGDCDVETYTEQLREVVDIAVLGRHFYPDASAVTKAVARILPERGFLTAKTRTLSDIDPSSDGAVVCEPAAAWYDAGDFSRLAQNTVSLTYLSTVMQSLDAGRCIAVSLFSEDRGEYIGVIYGYDLYGRLYIADPETLEAVGAITCAEAGRRTVSDDTGTMTVRTFFEWSGLGFDSASGDRICFFSAAGTSSGSNQIVNELIENATSGGGDGDAAADESGSDAEDGGTDGNAVTDGTADYDAVKEAVDAAQEAAQGD